METRSSRTRRIQALVDGDPSVTEEEVARYQRWRARGGEPPLLARLAVALEIPEAELLETLRDHKAWVAANA